MSNDLVEAGVTGIMNFAPTVLQVPDEVTVNNVNLAIELRTSAILSAIEDRLGGRFRYWVRGASRAILNISNIPDAIFSCARAWGWARWGSAPWRRQRRVIRCPLDHRISGRVLSGSFTCS